MKPVAQGCLSADAQVGAVVIDLPVARGGAEPSRNGPAGPAAKPGLGTPCLQGAFVRLMEPRPAAWPGGSRRRAAADGLELHWHGTDTTRLQLTPPGSPTAGGPGCWTLLVPLEPLLLQASAAEQLQNLVFHSSDALGTSGLPLLLGTCCSALVHSAGTAPSPHWLRLEQQLIVQLVNALQRPDLAGSQWRERGWRHLTLTLNWMAEHLEEDFRLVDVAAVAGITPRALQMAYRRHLDKRPLQSLRLLRLAQLRQLLLLEAPSQRLGDLLDRCGLSSSGSTARHYREHYGENPSQTLRPAPGLA